MDLALLHPLYEHSGSWASVHVDTFRHPGSTPHERHLTASAPVRRLAEQGADEATCSAVRTAAEGVTALVEAAREHRVGELLIHADGCGSARIRTSCSYRVRRTELEALGEQNSWAPAPTTP